MATFLVWALVIFVFLPLAVAVEAGLIWLVSVFLVTPAFGVPAPSYFQAFAIAVVLTLVMMLFRGGKGRR